MTNGPIPLAEFDLEMTLTRRLIERVPSAKVEWRPHPKSFPLGHLTQLVAWIVGWIPPTLRGEAIDLNEAAGYSFETTEAMLRTFDANVTAARQALTAARDGDFALPWELRMGDRVLHSAPRGVVARNHISHLVHHRGQLTVYLRLLEVPLPSIYGPTADERPW